MVTSSIRFIPSQGALAEITSQTFQGRYLLQPSAEVNERIVGALYRARQLHPVKIITVTVMSNHFHLILWARDAEEMAGFMGCFKSIVAREVGRLHGWSGKFWHGRYKPIVVSEEEAAQAGRLKYVLSQGVKEGLVARPEHWPGVNSIGALLTGSTLKGRWRDRTAAYRDRLRNPCTHDPDAFDHPVELELDRLPCWDHLTDRQYRAVMAGLIEEIVREGAALRRLEGIRLKSPRGARRAILRRSPLSRPKELARGPCPRFVAATGEARAALQEAYAAFVVQFRRAADEQRRGSRDARFPVGSFPPGLPFVRAASRASP